MFSLSSIRFEKRKTYSQSITPEFWSEFVNLVFLAFFLTLHYVSIFDSRLHLCHLFLYWLFRWISVLIDCIMAFFSISAVFNFNQWWPGIHNSFTCIFFLMIWYDFEWNSYLFFKNLVWQFSLGELHILIFAI